VATRIVIIGGGPAGYEAALVAAARGLEVADVTVVDCDGIGGACVLWDCVPSKTFIASTDDQQPRQETGGRAIGRYRGSAAERGRDADRRPRRAGR
jgi:pyruvate/2-oxoglutarate dehydrogenase complex dihydrolipoamide dehydrogenase (E3) component